MTGIGRRISVRRYEPAENTVLCNVKDYVDLPLHVVIRQAFLTLDDEKWRTLRCRAQRLEGDDKQITHLPFFDLLHSDKSIRTRDCVHGKNCALSDTPI
jgi:hypothetical protein